MNSIQKVTPNELAMPLSDIVKAIKVGNEALTASKAELRAMTKMGTANEQRIKKLEKTQKLAEDLLDAEVKLGEIIASLPSVQGKRTDLPQPLSTDEQKLTKREAIEAIGLSMTQAQRYQSLAANPEIVKKTKTEARRSGEIVSQSAVLSAIASKKKPYIVYNSHDSQWFTPSRYIESARKVMGAIDLDPASCAAANRIVKAEMFYTEENDGLSQPWHGRIWLNPPYSKVDKFVEKLLESDFDQAIVLVNNATETKWFCRLAERASAIIFHTGRLAFEKTGGETSKPMQGQAIIYIGDSPDIFLSEFSRYGWGMHNMFRKNQAVGFNDRIK